MFHNTRPPMSAGVQLEKIVMCFVLMTEAQAACEAGWQAVLVDRSMEQEGSIELTAAHRQNFMVLNNLNDLFGEDDEEEDAYVGVC